MALKGSAAAAAGLFALALAFALVLAPAAAPAPGFPRAAELWGRAPVAEEDRAWFDAALAEAIGT